MTINEIGELAYSIAIEKGWYEYETTFPERIALIHSEVSEALEAYRNGKEISKDWKDLLNTDTNHYQEEYQKKIKGTIEEEMADIVIRVAEYCARSGINLEQQILLKMRYNGLRPHKHGGKKC